MPTPRAAPRTTPGRAPAKAARTRADLPPASESTRTEQPQDTRTATPAESTRIQLCGRLSVEIKGEQRADSLRGKQVPLLLAYLLLNRTRYVGREELIGALWPDDAPRSQDAALRTLLSRLRSALGANALTGRDELHLTLPEPVWIDMEAAAVEVQRAEDTLDGGDARGAWALAQVPLNIASRGLLPGAQAIWLESRRRDLEDIRRRALEVIGRAGLSLGGSQLASVERAARNLIEAEPYRESGYVLLMQALDAQGNVAEGVRAFDQLRTLLRDELGTTPSPETMAVHERLLRAPAGRARATSAAAEAGAGDGVPTADLQLPSELHDRADAPLVGRARELGELEALWAAGTGEVKPTTGGRVALIVGDAGIGKTRLAAELARRAHAQHAYVLPGRSSEDTLVPYQPFLEALRHYLLNVPLTQLHATAREYGGELARLVPELRRRAPDLPAPPEGEPETERYRLFEAVVGLLSAISEHTPVLIVLDDLQWADRPTLLLLRHLARARDPVHLLIMGTYRSAEPGAGAFADALADLHHERLVTEVHVSGLSERETAELVTIRTGQSPSRAFARALHAETEGNPFFIEEIVRQLAEAGVRASDAGAAEVQRFGLPEGVKQVIARRIARLSKQTTEWLRVAAVIGRDFDASLLERVVSLDEDEFLDALDAALAAGVVVEKAGEPGRYSFSHTLIRETLYEGMSAPRRARTHKRVGEALEAARRESLPSLALHFTRAAGPQDTEKAITYALRAGEQATAMLAHEEAAEHYSRALAVLERFEPGASERRRDLLLLLGEAQLRAGESALAGSTFRDAAALAEELGDSAGLARAAIGASRRYVQQPGVVETDLIAMLKRALEATAGERTLVRVRLLARLCGAIYYSGERAQMLELAAEASEIADELGDPEAKAYASAARRRALWDPAHLEARVDVSTEMLTHARRAQNLELELQAHAWLVVDLLEDGNRAAVDAQIEAFTAGADRLRQPAYLWHAMVWRAMLALMSGHLERAEELASDALAAGAPSEAGTAQQYYAAQMLAIRREQGRMAELEQPARQFFGSIPGHPTWPPALATLLCETGKTAEARAEFEVLAAQDFANIRKDGDWMTVVALLSEVCAMLGDGSRAAILYDLLLPYREANVIIGLAAVCLGSVEGLLGKLSWTAGRDRAAAAHFERALEANSSLRAPVALAHTQLDYARALGPGARATELITAAARTADDLGLPQVAHLARELRKS